MRQWFRYLGFGVVLLPMTAGCGGPKNTFVRDKVTKVTGVLLIDGKPEPMVGIRLDRVGEPDKDAGTSKTLTPSGMTDAEGKFAIGTYDFGPEADGVRDGSYSMTFRWGQISLLSGRYEGDKFYGKYGDPGKSEFKVDVAGKPVDLGTIKLSMEGVVAKQSPIPTTRLGGDEPEMEKKSATGSRPRGKKRKDD